jgi:hypothetical protein
MTRPDTKGIKLTPAMIECLKCIIWAQQNLPDEVDVFWEDLHIMIDALPDKRAIQ